MRYGFPIAVVCSSIVTVACAPAPSEGGPDLASGDGGAPRSRQMPRNAEASLDVAEERAAISRVGVLPASTTSLDVSAVARSTVPLESCRLDVPPGACDRCPDRPCRQVRTSPGDAADEVSWAMFCEEGDLIEEAQIACLCAGAGAMLCERSAMETAQGLLLLGTFFGGAVPPVGTRYRDSSGLRATVDQALHDWLAAIARPPTALRCDEPDREAVARDYVLDAQRVRLTGSCL